ncbi:hypothetical protein [Deinococcus misasensis]|uniref:hypothetical protein n=1 Tax=Deinococcus misasensis TaxID=392413 RepID=UPI0005556497|nr:hypothetical protein [Deinococcus misasensis]
MSFDWKSWVAENAQDAVQHAEQKAKESGVELLGEDKKKIACDFLTEKLEMLDDKIPVLGAFLDFPIVDRLQRWAVEQAVEWAWGRLEALKGAQQ